MRYHKLVSVGLVLLLVGSLSGVSIATSLSTTSQSQSQVTSVSDELRGGDSSITARDVRSTDVSQQGGQVNLSEVEITAIEAIELAQNRTDGKPVVVALTTRNETPVFNVTFLHENRSITQVTVDATDRTVTSIRRNITVVRTEFLGGEAFDYTELRTATDAIRLVQNETNGTVVNVGLRRGQLVYGVLLRTPEGAQTRALVTATTSPILGIQTSNATTSATNSS